MQHLQRLFQRVGADAVGFGQQLGDDVGGLARVRPLDVLVGLKLDCGLGLGRRRKPCLLVVVNGSRQVGERVEVDVGQLPDRRVNVARQRHVDHADRLVLALLQRGGDLSPVQDRRRTRGAADHDVVQVQGFAHPVEAERLAPEFGGERLRLVARAPGDGDLPGAVALEMARGQLDHPAGAEQQDAFARQVLEQPLADLYRRRGVRHRVFAERGLLAYFLRDLDRPFEQARKRGAGKSGVA